MLQTMPMIEARNKFTSLPEALESNPEAGGVAITRRGIPVMAIMSWEFYESLLETLEIMGDQALVPLLSKSLNEATRRKTISWETVKKKLNA